MRVSGAQAQVKELIAGATVVADNDPSDSLLGSLPPPTRALIETHGRTRGVTPGKIIAGVVVFPRSALISICMPLLKSGHCPEVGVVGREGIVGIQRPALVAIAQTPGTIITIPFDIFSFLVETDKQIAAMDAACKDWLTLQAQVLAACNGQHTVSSRFCFWLLRASNAIGRDAIPMTQEAIAEVLGIARTSITNIVADLEMERILSHSRGRILIRNRAKLVAKACDCHRAFGQHNWPSKILKWDKALS